VKKTLLSLAIAASTVGLTACNISSTSDNNQVNTNPVNAGKPGTTASTAAPVFSAARANLPLAIDLLFASAADTDGTAAVSDTTPPVTTMINDLAGFSATATIDLPFSAPLTASSVVAGQTVFLIELKSNEDNSLIDSLDLTSIVAVDPTNPFAETADQPVPGVDYTAEYVVMENGAAPTIRIHPKKPLDPKTKYIVALTNGIKDASGNDSVPSSEYGLLRGDGVLPNPALAPVREAIQGWEQLAGGFLTTATSGAVTQSNVILSYAFTTEANTDILLSMAAPENYIYGLLGNAAGLEGALSQEDVDGAIQTYAVTMNTLNSGNPEWVALDPTTEAGKLAIRITEGYQNALGNGVAEDLIGEAGVNSVIAAVDGIVLADGDGVADTEQEVITVKFSDEYKEAVRWAAANGAAALGMNAAAHRPESRDFKLIGVDLNDDGNFTDASEFAAAVTNGDINTKAGATVLPNDNAYYQGMLTLPQYMKDKDATDETSFTDFWRSRDGDGISQVGGVIDAAFGNDPLTTPPKDDDGTGNVTYRFPFAQHVEDIKVPVLVSLPTDGACTKPYKTIIFQHGITTDRTASIGFANGVAAPTSGCFATVAMDLPTHGLDAASTDRNGTAKRYAFFDTFNVAGYVTGASTTPFAAIAANPAVSAQYTGLQERHSNLYLNAAQQPTAMDFTPDAENGDTGTGNSGSFFINLTNMQQTRDHMRQGVMDLLNLNASIPDMDVDGDGAAGDLDENNLFFAGHSLGAIVGVTYVAVNNAVAGNANITDKELNPIKAAVFANPGGQLPKLLENSPSFSAQILPGLEAAAGLTQGMLDLEKFFATFQAPLDSVDPVNFTGLLSATGTPVLIQEMIGGGAIADPDRVTLTTGLSDELLNASGYPADTVVPNNANPALNAVPTGLSYLAGTDPLVEQLELDTVNASVAPGATPLQLVARFKEGTHGTFSSADAGTVFEEMVGQAASFFATSGTGITIGDADQLEAPAAE